MKLFEPGRIGRLSLKNRIVMAPMLTVLAEPVEEGRLSSRDVDFYVARAKGGVGLIITTVMRLNRRLEAISFGDPVVDSPRCIRWLNDLAEAVHGYGAKVCVQLSPGLGRNQAPNPALPHGGLVSASPLPSFFDPNIICHELTIEEVEQLMKDYEFSAKIVSSAGIDAIEIHAHEGFLTDQFMTALWNKRTDKYGGDLDGRLRFAMELVAAARRGAGVDFPLTFRYGLTHYLDGGRSIEEGLEIARRLEAAGVDALHIDSGAYENNNWVKPPTSQPPGCMVDLAELAKKIVNIPVITVGKLQYPELAERVLQEGKADFIALGRSLLADPEWANKVKEGRPEDIAPCLGCHEGCLSRVYEGKYASCAVNPACGKERDYTITPAKIKKSVLVIGGGPGGMEAARVAALRGHKVTLWEKGYVLGGNLIPAAAPEFKLDYKLLLDYLITQTAKLSITTKLGQEATPELVQEMNPEVVFIATGAIPITKPSKCTQCGICDISKFKPTFCYVSKILGLEKGLETGKVVTAVDVLLGKKWVGESVVIIGGGMVGCETGLYLGQKGRKVTIVARHDAMRDMMWVNAMDIREKLGDASAKILTDTDVLEITDGCLIIAGEQGDKSTLEADTIVLAGGMKPNTELLEALQDKLPEVYAIGDCVKPRLVLHAIWEGFRTARLI